MLVSGVTACGSGRLAGKELTVRYTRYARVYDDLLGRKMSGRVSKNTKSLRDVRDVIRTNSSIKGLGPFYIQLPFFSF